MEYHCTLVKSTQTQGHIFSKPKVNKDEQTILSDINGFKIVAQGDEILLLDTNGNAQWSKPFRIEGRPNNALLFEDRILLTSYSNHYHSWGVLGSVYLIDCIDGSLIAELKGQTSALVSNGQFILGMEGYDVFNTWLYDRNGKLLQDWRSYGHYLVNGTDIRVLEKDRQTPTKSKLVRLNLDGSINTGPALTGSQVCRPLMLSDHSALFIDCGKLRIIDFQLKEQFTHELMKIEASESWRFTSNIHMEGSALGINICERSREAPIEYTTYNWQFECNFS